MVSISLCMIVKNEEHTLAKCLDSVKDIVDEIVIVDTGSTDRTQEIISRYTDRIYDFEWIDDFAAARNYSFSLAQRDYILWLDADDHLAEQDREKLFLLKQTLDPAVDSVSMEYHVAFDQRGNPLATCRRNRLVKRSNHYKWYGAVHEFISLGPDAKILYSDAAVSHTKTGPKTDRNLKIYEKLIAKGEKLSPRDLFLYGDELVGSGNFERAIEQYIQFLEEKMMSPEDKVEACLKISQCYHQLGNQVMELQYLLKSFENDIPNAEQCCRMGNLFFSNQNWKAAIFWFEIAAQMEKPKNTWGLVFQEFYTWVPHQQLAICYGKLGMLEQAYYHNEMTRSYLPDDPVVLNNKLLLEQHLNRNGEGEQA